LGHSMLSDLARWAMTGTVLGIGLAGCATGQERTNQAVQSYNTAAAECTARKRSEEFKTQREWALCVNQAQVAIIGPVEPNGDLLAQETAYRLVLADEVDRKTITKDEANLKFAQFRSTLMTEGRSRAATQAQINSQNAAAAAAILNATRPAPTITPQPIVQTRPPPVNCNSVAIGNTISTNCF
jgi:hypothetical protein